MKDRNFTIAVQQILQEDPRYAPDAYAFVNEAVLYTAVKLKRDPATENRHVSGRELVEGVRDYAIDQFGPFAAQILRGWGVTDSLAIGNIVFNMVNRKLLGASDKDSIDDFKFEFDFDREFSAPFAARPTSKVKVPIIA